MTTNDSTQSRHLRELEGRSAHAHGMACLVELTWRAVFPAHEAIADLRAFDEDCPADAGR